jgi:dCMP deaminase
MKQKHKDFYLSVAKQAALLSTAKRKQVGAVVVKDNKIISFGYNGTLAGLDNTCEDEEGNTKPSVIHAEANAILKLAASTESATDASLFLTLSPCIECAKMIIISGITELYYLEDYRDRTGLDFIMNNSNINIFKMETK